MSKRLSTLGRWALVATATWLVSTAVTALLISRTSIPWENQPSTAVLAGWSWLSTALMAAALVRPVTLSRLRGARLFAVLVTAILGLDVVLTQVEAAVFLDVPRGELLAGAVGLAVRAVALAAFLMAAFDRGRSAPQPAALVRRLGAWKWVGRVALAAAVYLVLYFVAGSLIYPFVRSFYETQNLDVGWTIFPLQLARGALYVAFLLPLVRSLEAPRRTVMWVAALLVPAIAGALDLLVPNPYMPDWVRPWHFVEVGLSNLIFGLVIGRIFWRERIV